MIAKKSLTAKETELLVNVLQTRFGQNLHRHKGLDWNKIQAKITSNKAALWSLNEMERTGGEPDVVEYNKLTDGYVFYDCAAESPVGRRSVCYDREGLDSRKENKPGNTAIDLAAEMGIAMLTEAQYRYLQQYGPFDLKTSSWLLAPEAIRKLGGALFGDYRYGQVFVYHNGAQSYYAGRGFRGMLSV